MDLEFKAPNLESFYSPSTQERSLSPIWTDKDKPEDDPENAVSDGDDQGSVQGTDVENSNDHACNESLNDALDWENGIGTLAGSDLKFRMNEHGDIEVITESLDLGNEDEASLPNDENMGDGHEIGYSMQMNQETVLDISKGFETLPPILNEEPCDGTSRSSLKTTEVLSETTNNNPSSQPTVNEDKEDRIQNVVDTESLCLEEKEELNGIGLEDTLPELDPVLSEDMTEVLYGGTASEHKREEKMETECDKQYLPSVVENKTDTKAGSSKTAERSVCIICGRPATLANRFCSRQCIGKNAARQRRANLSAISKKKAGRKPLNKKRHHDYSSPHPNDVLTVVHDESPGKRNDLKIKIRWSSSVSNENHDEAYSPEPRETTKRRAAAAAGNYAYAGYIRGARRKRFSWSPYLAQENAIAATPEAFEEVTGKNPFPTSNGFEVGMALEGVDPEHEALICPLFVAEVRGCRIRLSFCGYSGSHDFWRNANSRLVFPCGFCKETNRILQPPKDYKEHNFNWEEYLKIHRLTKAPRDIFAAKSDCKEKFEVGHKLEAVDKHNPSLVCVATIQDVLGDHLLIHFDGWSHNFDYWCLSNSKYIHSAGWCFENDKELSPPLGYEESKKFSWDNYLREAKASVADRSLFAMKPTTHNFETGMRLEAVDPRNRILVRAATITEIKDFQVKIHFDGWSDMYDFWTHLEDFDLHPVGWCQKTGHPLEPPVSLDENNGSSWQTGGCPIPGCRGIGHIQGAKFQNHYSEFGCPYSPQNLTKEHIKDRLSPIKSRRSTQTKDDDDSFADEDEDCDHFDSDFTSKGTRVLNRKRNGSFYNPPSPSPIRKRTRGRPEVNYENSQEIQDPLHNIEIVSKWTTDDVAKFVEEVTNDSSYGKIFSREEIDGKAALMLSQADILTVLKIKLGPAVKIYNAISTIKEAQ